MSDLNTKILEDLIRISEALRQKIRLETKVAAVESGKAVQKNIAITVRERSKKHTGRLGRSFKRRTAKSAGLFGSKISSVLAYANIQDVGGSTPTGGRIIPKQYLEGAVDKSLKQIEEAYERAMKRAFK